MFQLIWLMLNGIVNIHTYYILYIEYRYFDPVRFSVLFLLVWLQVFWLNRRSTTVFIGVAHFRPWLVPIRVECMVSFDVFCYLSLPVVHLCHISFSYCRCDWALARRYSTVPNDSFFNFIIGTQPLFGWR